MKKLFAIMSAVLALAACSKGELAEVEEQKQDNAASNPVTFNITVDDMGTKALKTGWADGDVIYIKFSGINDKYVYITYNGSSWNVTQSTPFDASDFDGKTKQFGAVHFPVPVNANLEGTQISLVFKDKAGKSIQTYFLYQSNGSYTVSGAEVNLRLSLQKHSKMALFHVAGIQASASEYTLAVSGNPTLTAIYPPYCGRIGNTGSVNPDHMTNKFGPVPGVADSDGAVFAVWLEEGFNGTTPRELTFTLIHSSGQEYSISGSKIISAGKQYELPALNSNKWSLKYLGPFTVSARKKVFISPGNLQYQASTKTWRFAPNQWDAIGNDNKNVAEDYSGWIDLFAWGTSGYNHGATCYQPWNHSSSIPGDYYAYGVKDNSLSDGDGRADWGYNAISNFGNVENDGWRTLSMTEWLYICNARSDDWRYTMAEINTDGTAIKGVILFPNGFDGTAPTGVTFGTKNTNTNWTTQCTTSGWKALEKVGCVFLPVTGYRVGTGVSYAGSRGFYWASNTSGTDAYEFRFGTDYGVTSGLYYRYAGLAVRLVKDYK